MEARSHEDKRQVKRSVGFPIRAGSEPDWPDTSKVGLPNLQKPIAYLQAFPRACPRDSSPEPNQGWIVVRTMRNRYIERNVCNAAVCEIVEINCKPERPDWQQREEQYPI